MVSVCAEEINFETVRGFPCDGIERLSQKPKEGFDENAPKRVCSKRVSMKTPKKGMFKEGFDENAQEGYVQRGFR